MAKMATPKGGRNCCIAISGPSKICRCSWSKDIMIGLVLVTHGKLAEEFRHALEHVVGPQKAIETVCIGPEDDMDQRRQDILEAVFSADQGNGVIILTDMF